MGMAQTRSLMIRAVAPVAGSEPDGVLTSVSITGGLLMHTAKQPPFLSTRQGKLTLLLVCMAGFLDFIDTTIVNVALPSLMVHMHFSLQSLQWAVSGYLLTYGGFLLLCGRAADLLGRRRLLVA